MALDHKIKGMKVQMFPDDRYRLDWYDVKVNKPYRGYYEAYYKGKHVADVMVGKYQIYALIYTKRVTLKGSDMKRLCLHVAGSFTNPKV